MNRIKTTKNPKNLAVGPVDYFNKIELLALTMAKTIYEFSASLIIISSEKERAIKVLQSVSNYAI